MKHRISKILSLALIFSLALSAFAFSAADSYAAAQKPKYIAHRGWSTKAPENSRPALRLAAKNRNFYGVEFDIWESTAEPDSADPLLLVMHDENIKRMCGVSKNVRRITRANRTKYKIKSGSNIKHYRNVQIPTVEMALNAIWDNSNGAIPVIELKHRLSNRALGYLFDLIGDHKVAVISFEYSAVTDAVKMAKKRGVSKNVQTMYLPGSLSSGQRVSMAKKLKKAGINAVSLKYTYVSKTAVNTFHKYGIEVCTWTLPNKKTADKYVKMGVDYITANGAVY